MGDVPRFGNDGTWVLGFFGGGKGKQRLEGARLAHLDDLWAEGVRLFTDDGDTVAEVSKRWLRARDTYGIAIAPGEEDAQHHQHHP